KSRLKRGAEYGPFPVNEAPSPNPAPAARQRDPDPGSGRFARAWSAGDCRTQRRARLDRQRAQAGAERAPDPAIDRRARPSAQPRQLARS
ncbi:hypothetical protein ABTL95_19710, partial [Acinetobacter baumannii]